MGLLGISASLLVLFMLYRPLLYKYMPKQLSTYFAMFFVLVLFAKVILLLFLFPEDIVRLFRFVASKFATETPAGGISRSQF